MSGWAREITELVGVHPTMNAPMAALRERMEDEKPTQPPSLCVVAPEDLEVRQLGPGRSRGIFAGSAIGDLVARAAACPLTWTFVVVGTGVDPVTFRFSGGRSAD
jgi:hypothetical protein